MVIKCTYLFNRLLIMKYFCQCVDYVKYQYGTNSSCTLYGNICKKLDLV